MHGTIKKYHRSIELSSFSSLCFKHFIDVCYCIQQQMKEVAVRSRDGQSDACISEPSGFRSHDELTLLLAH